MGGYVFTYGAETRLATSTINGAETRYAYDREGRRVQELRCPTNPCTSGTTGAVPTTCVYDAPGQLAAEYSPQGHQYPDAMGYGKHFEAIVRAWRPDLVDTRQS